jgi:hypothetical protein
VQLVASSDAVRIVWIVAGTGGGTSAASMIVTERYDRETLMVLGIEDDDTAARMMALQIVNDHQIFTGADGSEVARRSSRPSTAASWRGCGRCGPNRKGRRADRQDGLEMTAMSRRRVWTAALVVVGSATIVSLRAGRPRPARTSIDRLALPATAPTARVRPAQQSVSKHGLPDFSNCAFSTAEPDVDWISPCNLGGRGRGLDRNMPAFGDALSSDEIERVIAYVRGFCTSRSWPIGNLNLPRALVTEKAFPENEALITTNVPTQYTDRVETRFVYERRVGPAQPVRSHDAVQCRQMAGGWNSGLGDIDLGFKQVVVHNASSGSIVSAAWS